MISDGETERKRKDIGKTVDVFFVVSRSPGGTKFYGCQRRKTHPTIVGTEFREHPAILCVIVHININRMQDFFCITHLCQTRFKNQGTLKADRDSTLMDRLHYSISTKKSANSVNESANSNENLTERQRDILSVMQIGMKYTTEGIAEKAGLKSSRTRELINELVSLGKIEKTSSTKDSKYKKK